LVKTRVINQLLTFAFGLTFMASAASGEQGRYLVALDDGSIVKGEKVSGWHTSGGTVSLDGRRISSPGKALRWLRNRTANALRVEDWRTGYIEFVGGDRFMGSLIGAKGRVWEGGMSVPAHLLVRPASTKRLFSHGTDVEIVRVLTWGIKRVVLRSGSRRRFQAGTVFLRDGARLSFVRIRWGSETVGLLLKEGARTVSLSDISEIHMPRIDPWEAHYRQLAMLSPGCKSHLIRLETTEGLVATGSSARFGARAFYNEAILLQVNERRKRYAREIARLEKQESKFRAKEEESRRKFKQQFDALAAEIKKETEAHAKEAGAMGGGLAKQLKADAVEFDRQRKQLRDKLAEDIKEIDKRVARLPESKRGAKRKTYVTSRQKAMERAMKAIDVKQRENENKRRANLDRLLKRWELKRQSMARERERLEKAKTRFEGEPGRKNHYLERLELVRKLLNALPGPHGNSETWCHMVQPAWSLDPLWVRFNTIVLRSSFSPDAVPLSRVRPTRTVSPEMLRWRVDRNIDGGPLCSGQRFAPWGFGVHAHSELTFSLPPEAISFQSRIGLDRIVDKGGCVRARIYLDSTDAKPVYESSLLIGSGKTVETGTVPLGDAGADARNLILQVDPAARDAPPKADPLNIRDKLDWLEPRIALDPERLRQKVGRYAFADVNAWRGWTVGFDKRGAYTWGSWFDWSARYERGLFLPTITAKGKAMELTRRMKIPASDKWLVVDVGAPDGGDIKTGAVALRIGDEEIPAEKIPVRQYWRPRTPPLVYSIEKYRGKDVKLQLAQSSNGKALYWRSIATFKSLPAPYVLKRVLEESGKGDMQVTRGLGLTLESGRIKKTYVLEALEVARLGGRVTFCNEVTGQLRYEYLYGVMVGCDWKGGDGTFEKLKDLKWLWNVLLTRDAGVSDSAAQRLKQAKGENFVLRTVDRTPSAWGGMSCTLTIRNRAKKDLTIFRVHGWGGLTESFPLKAGAEIRMHAHEGQRFEAHPYPADRRKSKPVARTPVNGDTVWEIK